MQNFYNLVTTRKIIILTVIMTVFMAVIGVASYFDNRGLDARIVLLVLIASIMVIYPSQLYQQLKEVNRKENLVGELLNKILASNSLEQAGQSLVNGIGELMEVERVTLRAYDQSQGVFSKVINEYRQNENILSLLGLIYYKKNCDQYLIKKIFEERQNLVLNNVEDSQYPEYCKEAFRNAQAKSIVIVPLIYNNVLLGELTLAQTKAPAVWKEESLELLNSAINRISIGIRLLFLNDVLKQSLKYGVAIRQLIVKIRQLETYETIFNYLLEKLILIYNVNYVADLHYDKDHNLYVHNEVLASEGQKPLKGQILFYEKQIKEIMPAVIDRAIVINNIYEDITDEDIINNLKNKDIISFLLYPLLKNHHNHDGFRGMIILCNSGPGKWKSNEISSFKLAIDTISIIYNEIEQKTKIEKQRNAFIATLTHDLRSPIFAEQKALEFMLGQNPETPIKNYFEYLDNIYKTNEDLLKLVENLLVAYHYESGRFKLNLEKAGIHDLINDVIKTLEPLIEENEIKLAAAIDPDLPLITVDKTEIERVLLNIINNAVKHNPKGTKVDIIAKKTDNEIRVAISDNGIGIPESERAGIFRPYPTVKRKVGTGLGLYLSKQIIEAHGGHIWFKTEEGKGTTFYFTLPIV